MDPSDARGPVLWEYRPPQAHPIVYAALLVFGFVFLTGSLEVFVRGARPGLLLLYAAPVAAVGVIGLLLRPGMTRIHENGVTPARPLVTRIGRRPFVPWDELAAVYPVHYDVTGAFVSPFASSDGKVTQMGLGLEWPDGRIETLKFTPTRFAQGTQKSKGYRQAIDVVRDVFARRGRPLVSPAAAMAAEERAALLAQARKPFLPFFAIVFLFACAAPLLAVLLKLDVPMEVALPLALLPPLGTSLTSWNRSRQRNRILNSVSRNAEAAR